MEIYFSLNNYLRKKFGTKVWKIPVDAGFTCPNLDGSKGIGGCTYCNNNSFVHIDSKDIKKQVLLRIEKLKKRNINKFIVYYQSYSNTYADLSTIKSKIESSLIDDNIVGIHIGTRPDVIDEDKLKYFQELSKKYDLFLELGLQSIHNKTLAKINRGHSFEDFDNAVNMCKRFDIKVCAHIIFGLPDETYLDMIETVKYLASIKIESVKFHNLHIVKNTALEKDFNNRKIKLLDEKDYINLIAKSLTLLPKETIIARLVGDASDDLKIAPKWPKSKVDFLNKLRNYMLENNLFQAKSYP